MTDLDTLVRSGMRTAAAQISEPDTAGLVAALVHRGRSRRHRRLPVLVAAALVAVAAIVAVAVRPDDSGQAVRAGASSTTTTAPATGFEALGPGWHDLDTGPVAASASNQLVWTGSELVVASSNGRTWRYRPDDRTWSAAAAAPLPPRSGGWSPAGAVWTGERVVAVFVDRTERWSASWDPRTDRWTPIGDVPVAPELTEAVGTTGVSISGGGALLWSGERVFDLAHLASLDPEVGTWEPLPLPDDLIRYAALLDSNPVFDGDEVVFTNVVGPGLAWDPAASGYRRISAPPAAVIGNPSVVPTSVAAARGGEVVIVSEDGGDDQAPGPAPAVALDASSGRWRRLPDAPGASGSLGCPIAAVAVGARVVVPRCAAPGVVVLDDGRWVDGGAGGTTTACCLGTATDAGGALVIWESDTDTLNNPEAPYVRARVWVPPR